MSDDTLDWNPYRSFGTTPTARSALRVTRALLDLHDHRAAGAIKRNHGRLQQANERLGAALDRRGATGTDGVDGRPVDLKADRAWGAMETRLLAWVTVGAVLGEAHAKVGRATELLAALFANGTEFLKLPYVEQDVEMERILRLVDSASLERDLVSLAGKEFVDALVSVQPEYSAMVRAMLERDEQKERVVGLVRAVARAAEDYSNSVIGVVDAQDPDSIATARRLLAPLFNHRSGVAAREGGSEKVAVDPKKEEKP